MSLTNSTQAQIAFKNISGKAQTEPNKGIFNEFYGSSFNIPFSNVWLDTITGDPNLDSLQGITVELIADLEIIQGSNNHSYITKWPLTPPSGIDIQTGNIFSYGTGSLIGINAGDRVTDVISPYFGFSYSAIAYSNYPSDIIPFLDDKNWIYQYNSGIYYQDNVVGATPSKIKIYPYIGDTLGSNSGIVDVSNGLSILNDEIVLGGTLSYNTYINADGFDLSFTDAGILLFNTSVFDVVSNGIISLDSGTGSIQILSDDQVTIYASNSIDLVSFNNINLSFSQSNITDNSGNGYGLVYTSDYSGTFITNSLVTKQYVDLQISSLTFSGGGGTGISWFIAGSGLTGGGTSSIVTVDLNVDNGISIINDSVVLGGTLSQTTFIETNTQEFVLGSVISSTDSIFNGLIIDNDISQLGYFKEFATSSVFISNSTSLRLINSNSSNQSYIFLMDISLGESKFYDQVYQKGIEYGGDYTSNFVTHSLITKQYVDLQISSLTFSGGTGISQVIAGVGLTGGGTSSIVTLDINVDNGLSISNDSVVFGGTLSQVTTLDANGFDLTIGGADVILFTSSTFDIEASGFVSIDAGTGSVQVLTDDSIGIFASNSVDILSNGNINISFDQGNITDNSGNGYGLVYTSDYSGTFITNSIVTKQYVDLQTYNISFGITAGFGLTGGGTGSYLTLDVNVNSDSLEITNDSIRLRDTILGDRTFNDSVTVTGNLTVLGTATIINTENLYVEDNIITLNATYSGSPVLDVGIEINRGTGTWSKILWNESIDYWQVGLSGSESTIITEAGFGLTKSNNTLLVDFNDSGTSSTDVWSAAKIIDYAITGNGTTSLLGAYWNSENSISPMNIGVSSSGDIRYIGFDITDNTIPTVGQLNWNSDDGTLDIGLLNNVTLRVGQEQHYYVKNQTGNTLLNGSVVSANGTLGSSGRILVTYSIADGSVPSQYVMGVLTQTITTGNDGYVTEFGLVRNLDTTGSSFGETWSNGDVLYVSPTIPGGMTKFIPEAPNQKNIIAIVVNADANGSLFVRPTFGSNLANDESVQYNVNDLQNNSLLVWNLSNQRWEQATFSDLLSANQYFTSSNDQNVQLNITSIGQTSSFDVSWNGILPLSRGGLSNSTFTASQILVVDSTTSSVVSSGKVFNDSGTSSNDIWSAQKTIEYISTITLTGARNSSNSTDVYLRSGDGLPYNVTPFVLPFDGVIKNISISTAVASTWTGEVRNNGVLITGASLTSTAQTATYSSYNIDVNAGDLLQLYCNGTGVNSPRMVVIIQKR